MIVVSDASPIHYLVLIEAADLLAPLYGRILVPQTVAGELQAAKTPAAVRAWIAQPPGWCEIRPDPPADPTFELLDAGERTAIALAISTHADRLLIDEWDGRVEAQRHQLQTTGTLGVLAGAHFAGLLDFETAVAQLRRTNFYISDDVVHGIRQRLAKAAKKA